MRVILKKDLKGLGRMGEIKEVKDGYARNFLIPQGIAEPATEGAIRAWKASEHKRKKKMEQEKRALEAIANKISQITLSFSRAVNPDGVMFGSVAKSDIVKQLKAADINISKDCIKLNEPIKKTGTFEIDIELSPDITAKLKVNVTAQS